MGTVGPLFDSNILIDFLKGLVVARDEINRYSEKAISVISWIEVMAGTTPQVDAITREFLTRFTIVPITDEITERTIMNRRTTRLKLPDAIILSTSQVQGRILVTRNTRDFSSPSLKIRIPYTL